MHNLAVIGPKDVISGFKALGMTVAAVESLPQAREKLWKLSEKKENLIIFITEDWAIKLEEELKALREKPIPVIIPIPGNKGSLGVAQAVIRSAVIKAIGKEIYV